MDIPVTDTGNGWQVQLPEETWDIVADCRTSVYQKTEDGRLRFLGNDHSVTTMITVILWSTWTICGSASRSSGLL